MKPMVALFAISSLGSHIFQMNFWQGPIKGSEIESLDIPKCGGVYLWRRTLNFDASDLCDIEEFVKFLKEALSAPFFLSEELAFTVTPGSQALEIRHGFAQLEKLQVGGGKLSAEKIDTLHDWLEESMPMRMDLLRKLVQSLELFGPVLYVGEAKSLRKRIQDHVKPKSALRTRLERLGLGIGDVSLFFAELEEWRKPQREALEQVLTILCVAPLTLRPG